MVKWEANHDKMVNLPILDVKMHDRKYIISITFKSGINLLNNRVLQQKQIHCWKAIPTLAQMIWKMALTKFCKSKQNNNSLAMS